MQASPINCDIRFYHSIVHQYLQSNPIHIYIIDSENINIKDYRKTWIQKRNITGTAEPRRSDEDVVCSHIISLPAISALSKALLYHIGVFHAEKTFCAK